MRLVYLSPVPWNSVAQRPHFFIKAAINSGISSIFWVEPTPSRLPQLRDFRTKLFSVEANSFDKPAQVEIFKIKCTPVEPFGGLYDLVNRKAISAALQRIELFTQDEDAILVIGKPSRFALHVMNHLNFQKTIFDVMDDFPQFYHGISAKSMENVHRQLIQDVNICFFSSHNLRIKYGALSKNSEVVLNACDEDFKKKCQLLREQVSSIRSGNRTFGYVGSIAEWFDWDRVIRLAEENPDDKVVIVGPNYSKIISDLPLNIELRRAIKHCEVPDLLMSFDFGLIPFKKNELTNSVDPVKYYEYCAAGLTVVSSRFGEMSQRIDRGEVIDINKLDIDDIVNNADPVTWKQRFFPFFEQHFGVVKV